MRLSPTNKKRFSPPKKPFEKEGQGLEDGKDKNSINSHNEATK